MASLDKIALSVVVFFVFIVGGVLFVHDFETQYQDVGGVEMGINDYIADTWNTTTGTNIDTYSQGDLSPNAETSDMEQKLQERSLGNLEEGGVEDAMFSGSFSGIKLITTPIKLIRNVMTQMSTQLGVPPIFLNLAFIALTIIVMFAVIYLIFRVKA